MNQKKVLFKKNKQTLELSLNKEDRYLEFKLDPKEYFYPHLEYGPNDTYDFVYHPEDPISKEEFEKAKKESVKKDKMFLDKFYKELFEYKFFYNLEHFLNQVEYEVEFEYENKDSLFKNESAMPISIIPFRIKYIPILDVYFMKNEDAIFEFLKKEDPSILSNITVLSMIQKWCEEKNFRNIKRLTEALKESAEIKRGPMPLSLERSKSIILHDFRIRPKIKELRKKIASYEEKKIKDLINKYKREESWWVEHLEEAVNEEFEPGMDDFIWYIKNTPPREISIAILAKRFRLSKRTIDEVFRNRKKIIELSKL